MVLPVRTLLHSLVFTYLLLQTFAFRIYQEEPSELEHSQEKDSIWDWNELVQDLIPQRETRRDTRRCASGWCKGICCGKDCCKKGWSCRYMSFMRAYQCIP